MIFFRFRLFFIVILSAIFVLSCKPDQKESSDTQKEKKDQEKTEEQAKETKEKDKKKEESKAESAKPRSYVIPEVVKYYKQSDEYLQDKLRPIGWSKDGNFAYITEPADEACGCYRMTITIQDMDTNEKLWTWDFESMDYEKTLEDIWEEKSEMFHSKLNKHNIIPQDNFNIKPREFTYNGDKYKIQLNKVTQKDPYYNIEKVIKGDISIKGPNGKKHVKTYEESGSPMILGAVIQGHFKSPYEEKIAVIYKRERKGYEGPPHVVTFKIAGTSLN